MAEKFYCLSFIIHCDSDPKEVVYIFNLINFLLVEDTVARVKGEQNFDDGSSVAKIGRYDDRFGICPAF